ncbi:MAG TPA: hypothetical protein VNN80_30600 [Polyangiaceae bacterium]|nr:hypothetical protein [Polyangiaceae bacterium]
MHRPSLPRVYSQHLLVAAVAFCAGPACQEDAPGGAEPMPGMPSTPGISPSGVLHVAQFGERSTVYRMNYVGGGAQ